VSGDGAGAPAFGGAAGFGRRPAVVVVDLIRGFTDPACPLGADLDDVVAATRAVLDAARAAALPVLFTTVVYDAEREREAAVFLRKVPALGVLRPGTPWIEVDERLGRRPDEPILVKAFASAFWGTDLAARVAGRDALVVCGATTSGCVRATVVDALQHGLAPIVPREAVGDRWPDAHAQSLHDMEQKYADVLAASDVLGGLREAAGAVDQARERSSEPG
jgi:nicotinamidase-related amidase